MGLDREEGEEEKPLSVSGNKKIHANSSQGRKEANIKNADMEIWRNYKQLNTLNQRSLTLAEKK